MLPDFAASPAAAAAAYDRGNAHVHLAKYAGGAVRTDALAGRLYFSRTGWLLMSVPNALGRGAFDALDEAGVELPRSESTGQYNAHVTVMRPDEVAACGGPQKITERGHSYRYTLGPVKTVEPKTWSGVSKVWYIQVESPDLKELRRSYGLTPLPHDNEYDFHITFGVRKTNVLKSGPASKAAADGRFFRPENYDKVRDLPDGRELWAGANDWEAGWTWAWVQNKAAGSATDPAEYTRVDHAACPGCKGTGEDPSAKADSLCVKHGKAQVDKWAAGLTKSAADSLVAKVADTWFRPDGSPKTRAMTQTMIRRTMRDHGLDLRKAAEVVEKAMLYHKNEHVVGGAEAYWELVDRMEKGAEEQHGPAAEYCPHCDARLERDPDSGTCNRCLKNWPVGKTAAEKLAFLLGRGAALEESYPVDPASGHRLISVDDLPRGPHTVCGGCGSPNFDGTCVDCGSSLPRTVPARREKAAEALLGLIAPARGEAIADRDECFRPAAGLLAVLTGGR